MGKVGNAIKKFPGFLFKLIILLVCGLLGLWLLQMVYFPQLGAQKFEIVSPPSKEEDIFGHILKQKGKDPAYKGHFHMVDAYLAQPEPRPPICLTCHGTYPHSKEKKVRSLLNAHTGFLACSVCHARREPGKDGTDFSWVDRDSGMITTQFEGEYGKYSAKIFPVKIAADGSKQIYRPVDEKDAQQFMKFKDKYTPDQIAEAKIKLHGHISEKPVFCVDCHQKDGYLDFVKMGFPPERINHLNSTEVVGLIAKYKTFYMPSIIDFGSEKPLE